MPGLRGPPENPGNSDVLSRMERDWDARAREAPEYFIATGQRDWQKDDFFQSGAANVHNEILVDRDFIARGRPLNRMRVLEIGCGAGRMTRAMANVFGEVHAVDISAEMIALARRNLSGFPNAFLYKNDGAGLSALPDHIFDFAFSFIVFQHIPSLAVIENYLSEVRRCLRRGALFKFQVQGGPYVSPAPDDTWLGVTISLELAQEMAVRSGFDLVRAAGQGTQYFWLWFQKPRWPWIPRVLRRSAPKALTAFSNAAASVPLRFTRPVAIAFSPSQVRVGEGYCVRIPTYAGQAIDVGYELHATGSRARSTGVVDNWCSLDSQGEARIVVPVAHPTGVIHIRKVRPHAQNTWWRRSTASIQVLPAAAAFNETSAPARMDA